METIDAQSYWSAVARSADVLPGESYGIEVDGTRVVLWRLADNHPAVLSDICVHQGDSIARGWVTEDRGCVVCPNHQWAFDDEGRCTDIPSNLAGLPIPEALRVQKHPCVEIDGIIWAHVGEHPDLAEAVPVPDADTANDQLANNQRAKNQTFISRNQS